MVAAVAAALLAVAPAVASAVQRVSVGAGGVQSNGSSILPQLAGHGAVAYLSTATNLVPGDATGEDWSVFAWRHGRTRLAGSNIGVPAGEGRDDALGDISNDGRYVVFDSWVALVPTDTNGQPDVYLRDLVTGGLRRISVSSAGVGADGWSFQGTFSGDGRWVAFASAATNLHPSDDGQGSFDIYLHDLRRRTTARVAATAWDPALDRHARTVAFVRLGGTDPIGVVDLRTGVSEIVSVDTAGRPGDRASYGPVLSADGRFVAFTTDSTLHPGDVVRPPPGPPSGGGGWLNVYLRDRAARTTEQVDVSSAGAHGNATGSQPSISDNGRWVAFTSYASNLVPGDTNHVADAFARDRRRHTTERVSVTATGAQADLETYHVGLDRTARRVAFASVATNLVPGDTNLATDIFVRRLGR